MTTARPETRAGRLSTARERSAAAARRVLRSAPIVWCRSTGWPWLRDRALAAWRVAGPVLSTVTGFGWCVLLAAVAAGIAGLRLGWVELLAISVVCLTAFVIAIGFAIGRSAFQVSLDLALTRVVVGERAVGRISIANPGARPTLPARIELPVGSSFASFHLPRLAPGAEHDDLFGIPTSRRSVIAVGPVRSVRGDPLGLVRREVRWTEPVELYVHPRTVGLEGSSSGFLKDLEGVASTDLSNDDVSFHALREYVPGDDRRYIHWRTSARTGTLMVRQFEETRRSHLALALSTAASDYVDADEFELAVSACGSLGLQALKEERDVTVLVQGSKLRSETGRRLLDDLSGVEQRDMRETVVQLAKVAGQSVPNASVAVLVFGGEVTPTRLQSAAVHVPLGVRVIGVSCRPGAALTRHQIGDLTLLTVGDLADLPGALRRVNR